MIVRCIASAMAIAAIPAATLAQEDTPEFAETAIRDIDFVPREWKLFDKVQGDLNGDGMKDSVLVIQATDPALQMDNPDGFGSDYYDANRRILLVLLADAEAGYRLVGRDENVIPDWDSPTIIDPLDMIEIGEDGKMTLWIRFWASAGSWTMSSQQFHFRWDDEKMDLIGYDYSEIHRASGEMKRTSINYLTGRRWDGVGNISSDDPEKQWSRIDRANKPQLGSIGDAYEFEP